MRWKILTALGLFVAVQAASCSGIRPEIARMAGSTFTVVVRLQPMKGGYTVQAHTRIGATCSGLGIMYATNGSTDFPSQHVGRTGIITWNFPVATTQFGVAVVVNCTWKGQSKRGESSVVASQLPATGRKPILGSSASDWSHAYGKPNPAYRLNQGAGPLQFGACRHSTDYQWDVNFVTYRAATITHYSCGHGPVPSQWAAFVAATSFFPVDARAEGVNTDTSGITEQLFSSKELAPKFPSIEWQDCNGHQVAPGTFSFNYDPQERLWSVGAGTCS